MSTPAPFFSSVAMPPPMTPHDHERPQQAAQAHVVNQGIALEARKEQGRERQVQCPGLPVPLPLVAQVLVHDVPADVLAGPAAVVRPEAPDALPPRPPAAEAAGPAAPADPPLLEGPAGPAVQGDDGAHDDGGEGAEPAAPDDGRPDLPGHVGAAEGGQDVGRHGLQPVVVVQVAAPSALGRPGGGGGEGCRGPCTSRSSARCGRRGWRERQRHCSMHM